MPKTATHTLEKVAAARLLIAEGQTQTQAALVVGMSRQLLAYHLSGGRHGVNGARPSAVDRAATRINGDEADIITEATSESLDDIDALLLARNLDPADWSVESITVNEWDSPTGETLRQLKLHCKRRTPVEFVFPATPATPRSRPAPRDPGDGPILVVAMADQQAPYQDEALHDRVLEFLHVTKPDEVVLAGDTIDLPNISRHKDNPEWHVTVQECINTGYRLLSEYVEAAPAARFTKLLGNHDERIRNELLLRAERLYGVRPADVPGEPPAADALSVARLLRLDELGIELQVPDGGYEHAQVNVSDGLAIRHGWLTGANTAEKSLKQVDYSMVVFHTHRQALFARTVHRQDGSLASQVGVEGGCLCRVRGGLGYAVDPNWQQGFVTAAVWPAGEFQLDFARWDGEFLYWRGERF